MPATKSQIQEVIDKVENGDYKCYFYCPDYEKPSGGIKVLYDHVKCMNENGFNGVVIHKKTGFRPEWLDEFYEIDAETGQYKGIPTIYLDDENLGIGMEDFFFIPEGIPNVMKNLAEQNAPCKRIVFCQNWYYVLNSLPVGVYWNHFGITDCMSVSNIQSDYLKMIMPFLKIKNVVGHIPDDVFYPPEKKTQKKLQVAFIPSRFDNGTKSANVIKTFFSLYPFLRFIEFKQVGGMTNEQYAELLRESAFYVHFDEYSSWGTAPIEAYLSKCLVAGWDGFGGREYMNPDNTWVVPNGDILRLAMAIGNMIETYLMDDVKDKTYQEMEAATMLYTREAEKDSILKTHNEYREERVKELEKYLEIADDDPVEEETVSE